MKLSDKLNDYIEKIRAKPRRERERIAVIATGISFVIILVIWLVSFSEINKVTNEEENNSAMSDQLDELGDSVEEDGQSIEEMMQNLPQDSTDFENLYNLDAGSQEAGTENQNQDQNAGTNTEDSQSGSKSDENQGEIPQLP